MQKFIIPIAFLLACLGACDDRIQPMQDERSQQIKIERQQRELAEKRADESQKSRDWWEAIASVLGAASILFLIIGACLGSSGRNHVPRD